MRTRWLVASMVLLLLGGAVATVLVQGGRHATPSATATRVGDGGTLTYAAPVEPTGFNVNKSTDGNAQDAVETVYPAVFRVHPDFSVRLDQTLMVSAELTSERPETITYRIQPNATWSDGVPVSAEDFIYLWRNSNGSNSRIDVASTAGYQDIRSVTAADGGKTVTVVFMRPFADWRSLFGNLLPAHYVQRQPGGWNTGLNRHPERIPSAGPFRISRYVKGESLTLERNPRYWGPRAHLDRIVFRFVPDPGAQVDALRDGEADLIHVQPQVDLVRVVEHLPAVRAQLSFGLTFEHVDFNLRNPLLADLRVRSAIALAIDRHQLVDRTIGLFSGNAQVLGNRMWLTGQPRYEDHAGPYGQGNAQAAAGLLERAGWRRGADGIYAKGGRRLALRLSTTMGDPLRRADAQLIQDQLRRAGIAIDIRWATHEVLFADWLPHGNFDLTEFAWIGNPFAVSANQAIYVTRGNSNWDGFADPVVDALFGRATAALVPDHAAALANQIDRELWRQLPSMPLFQRPSFLAWRGTLLNVADNASTEGPFWNAGAWGFARK